MAQVANTIEGPPRGIRIAATTVGVIAMLAGMLAFFTIPMPWVEESYVISHGPLLNVVVMILAVALLPVVSSVWSPRRLATRDRPDVRRLISDVGLKDKADAIAGTLSYGDRKRVELAISLASAPRLLLMDEPTAGMAAAEREALMAAAVEACRQRGASILFTEHDMGVVFRHADRVLVLSAGRLIADGVPDEIRASQAVREVYLGRADGKAKAE